MTASRLPAEVLGGSFSIERPKRADHGDLAINAALALSKPAKMPPRAVAELLKGAIEQDPSVASADIAGNPYLGDPALRDDPRFGTFLDRLGLSH